MATPTERQAVDRVRDTVIWGFGPPDEPIPDAAAQTADDPQLPIIKTDADLDAFLWDYFGVRLPNKRCCSNHRTPWEAFHDAYFARSPVAIWKGSRNFAGKTFMLGLLGQVEALTLRCDVNILGGSGEQSKRVLEHISSFWESPNAPRWALPGEPGASVQKLTWGNRIKALMASQASVRGPHPQRLRMDEIDEMKVTILKSALGQPQSRGLVLSQVVMASTHQYADGTMTWALKEAAARGWPVFEWCLEETKEPHGWLSQAEIDRKRSIMTIDHWNVEVLMGEPTSEGRAFDTGKVEAAFQVDAALAGPVDGATYGSGADWAKKVNHTVVITIRKDVRPRQVVAIKRTQKEPWPNMAGYLDSQVAIYGGTSTHDNTGIGQVVHDLLHHDSEPFNMVGRDRADLLTEYIAAIEKGDLVWPRKSDDPDTQRALDAAYSEHKYASRDAIYKGTKDGSGRHHLPDTVSAGALAWRAAAATTAASGTSDQHTQDTTHLQSLEDRQGRMSHAMGISRLGNRRRPPVVMPGNQDDEP